MTSWVRFLGEITQKSDFEKYGLWRLRHRPAGQLQPDASRKCNCPLGELAELATLWVVLMQPRGGGKSRAANLYGRVIDTLAKGH